MADDVPSKPDSCEAPTPSDTAPTASTPSAGNSPPDEMSLLEALRDVVDPELMINVVDLGLVYSVQQENDKVCVEMTLTSPACPAGPQIVSQAKLALEKVEGVKAAEIKLVMSPPWTPDRMTDEARDQLGIF
jgi:metal-sulfur cluster biosynthetic enzyme